MNVSPLRTLLFFLLIPFSRLVAGQAGPIATQYIIDAFLDFYRMERDYIDAAARTILPPEVRADLNRFPDAELPRHFWNTIVRSDPRPSNHATRNIELIPAHEILPRAFRSAPILLQKLILDLLFRN